MLYDKYVSLSYETRYYCNYLHKIARKIEMSPIHTPHSRQALQIAISSIKIKQSNASFIMKLLQTKRLQ